jgi:hypothetical protein
MKYLISRFLIAIVFYLAVNIFCSCEKNLCLDRHIYSLQSTNGHIELDLNDWLVVGALPISQDSLLTDSFIHLPRIPLQNIIPDTITSHSYNGIYLPLYGQLDLKEVYGIAVTDTTKALDSLITYLSCTIKAEKDVNLFLYVRTEMRCKEYLNGDTLTMMPFKEMEIYPIHLKAGDNTLTVRTQGAGRKYWYEATLCDSISMYKRYSKQHTGNIVFPIIRNDSVHLTEGHWNLCHNEIRLLFHDVRGREATRIPLEKDIFDYPISGTEKNHAYICSMIMGNDTVRQPVITGTADFAELEYKRLRDSITDAHPRAAEIDQLLYRLWKLQTITGKMRTERWYDFKLPWVIYQLEHTFTHLDGTYGNDDNEYNFKYITYHSKLDDGLQRYVLVTPNSVDRSRKYPLVVVVRPCNEKRYHLFFCPQIAHQHVVNDMQAIANEFDCFVIMPEARMLLNEDLTPFAEAEMRLALDDAQEHYNIDPERIFLHANCSGGYRALRLAVYNPDIFAGIALYAPVYRRNDNEDVYMDGAPEKLLENLRNTPVFIFGDPADTHSPISVYADLVKDCEKIGISYELVLRRNTGQGYHGYHRHVVGREACEFFKDRKKIHRRFRGYKPLPEDSTIADFYSKPFIYIYNVADTSKIYKEVVDSIRNEYELYLYSKLPLYPDMQVTQKMLKEKNVFLIGDQFGCYHVKNFAEAIQRNAVCPVDSTVTLAAYNKPYNWEGKVLLYTSGKPKHFKHIVNYPWKRGFRRTITKRVED